MRISSIHHAGVARDDVPWYVDAAALPNERAAFWTRTSKILPAHLVNTT